MSALRGLRAGMASGIMGSEVNNMDCTKIGAAIRQLRQELSEMDEAVLSELSQGLSSRQVEQLWEIMDVMLHNAFKSYRKGSEEESDKNACKEPAGI